MDAEPLDPKELHAFTDSMLPGCFHLLDELPDTVYRLCDLLMTAIKRNGPEYRDLILGQVVDQVSGLLWLLHGDVCIHSVIHTVCSHVFLSLLDVTTIHHQSQNHVNLKR